mmetsp:Transcript_8129/g.20892  ORF Transcript_8129/g.20892 Transcript_8129/m.20892 type:complete len:278 (+) Transcript_8129:1119-1952(+)
MDRGERRGQAAGGAGVGLAQVGRRDHAHPQHHYNRSHPAYLPAVRQAHVGLSGARRYVRSAQVPRGEPGRLRGDPLSLPLWYHVWRHRARLPARGLRRRDDRVRGPHLEDASRRHWRHVLWRPVHPAAQWPVCHVRRQPVQRVLRGADRLVRHAHPLGRPRRRNVPVGHRPDLAPRREQDCILQQLQDEGIHHRRRASHGIGYLPLVGQPPRVQVACLDRVRVHSRGDFLLLHLRLPRLHDFPQVVDAVAQWRPANAAQRPHWHVHEPGHDKGDAAV